MTNEHPNAALLRKVYGGDSEDFFKKLAPDYVCHIPGRSKIAGDYHGMKGHLRHREVFQIASDRTMKTQAVGSFLADDNWGFAPSRVTANRKDGATLNLKGFGLWRFRDGLVTDHWAITDDLVAFDEFFSR